MKKLTLALLLIASPAFAGGIYDDSTTTPATSGDADVETVLWTKTLPSGSISAANALRFHATAWTTGAYALMRLEVNGVDVGTVCPTAGSGKTELDVTLWRTGNATALVEAKGSTPSDGAVDLGTWTAGGFNWTNQQTLNLVGLSAVDEGVYLSAAGIER